MGDFFEEYGSRYVENIIETLLNSALGKISDKGRDVYQKTKIQLGISFKKYVKTISENNMFIKTIADGNPQLLEDVYVGTTLKVVKNTISSNNFLNDIIYRNTKVLLTGISGSGKTLLLKTTVLKIIKETSLIPVYISLRHYSDTDEFDLESEIYKAFDGGNAKFDAEYISYALKQGKCIIFLDGLDEVLVSKENHIVRSIKRIVQKHHNNRYVIASRKIDSLLAFEQFVEYHLQPFSMTQISEFIKRSDIKDNQKSELIERINSEYHDSYDFFGNPLLLGLAIKSLSYNPEFPAKIYEFYYRAFSVMFITHDKTKPIDREYLTRLNKKQFHDLCAELAFVAFSQGTTQYSFSELECFSYIGKCSSINVDASSFLSDLLRSVCLVKEENGKLCFVHRSFQEYFIAMYLMSMSNCDLSAFVMKHINRFSYNITCIMESIDIRKYKNCVMKELLGKYVFVDQNMTSIYKTNSFMRFCHRNMSLVVFDSKIEVRYNRDFSFFISAFSQLSVGTICILSHFKTNSKRKVEVDQFKASFIDKRHSIIQSTSMDKYPKINISDLNYSYIVSSNHQIYDNYCQMCFFFTKYT